MVVSWPAAVVDGGGWVVGDAVEVVASTVGGSGDEVEQAVMVSMASTGQAIDALISWEQRRRPGRSEPTRRPPR